MKIKSGKNLSSEEIDLMVQARIREYGENTKDFENKEQDSVFFFLNEDDKTKAFGMLKPVVLYYLNHEYPIMGVGNIMSLEKGKGYGTELMREITSYLKENNQVGLGNTHKDNFVFYEKCGYKFIPGLIDRVIYKNKDEFEKRTETEDYDMFIYDPKYFIKTITEGEDDVTIKVPFW